MKIVWYSFLLCCCLRLDGVTPTAWQQLERLQSDVARGIATQQAIAIKEENWCPAQAEPGRDANIEATVNDLISKFYHFCMRYGNQGPAKTAALIQQLNGARVQSPGNYIFMGSSDGLIYITPGVATAGSPVRMQDTDAKPIWHAKFATLKNNNYQPTWCYYPMQGRTKRSYIAAADFGGVRYLIGCGYFCQ
ncbi:hypothetical protein M1466_00800 [Candidatus Dependentiae bacterium]|nr:hypothetical protein [Candidatus Dependentiae bacterium]